MNLASHPSHPSYPSLGERLGRLALIAFVAILVTITLLIPPKAQAAELFTLTSVKAFSNAPSLLMPSAISNATVTSFTWKSNMIPVRPGKGLGIACEWLQASNGQSAAQTIYFGLIYNRTNTSTLTNFTWTFTMPASTAAQRAVTNIPAAVIDNTDGVFWFSSSNGATNALTGYKIYGLNSRD